MLAAVVSARAEVMDRSDETNHDEHRAEDTKKVEHVVPGPAQVQALCRVFAERRRAEEFSNRADARRKVAGGSRAGSSIHREWCALSSTNFGSVSASAGTGTKRH